MDRHLFPRSFVIGAAAALVAFLAAGTSSAAPADRNYDAREAYNRSFAVPMAPAQAALVAAMRSRVPDFTMTWDQNLGVVGSLSSWSTYLSAPARSGDRAQTALGFVRANLEMLGLTPADIAEYRITDSVYSQVSGATHIYMQQMVQGIPVYGAQLAVNVNRDGRILSVNNAFVRDLAQAVNVDRPAVSASIAMISAMGNIGAQASALPLATGAAVGKQQVQQFLASAVSTQPMTAQLMYLPIRAGEVRLVWNMGTLWTPDRDHTYEFNVDAQTGQVWTRFDTTSSGSYRVLARPVENPLVGARTLVVNPEDATASPAGWLTTANRLNGGTTTATSNANVNACTDRDANNACDAGTAATCTGAVCDFVFTPTAASTTVANTNVALTQLFYTNNIIHDIQYKYGFDEVGGNFQNNNFGRGGAQGDPVNADAQDGSGTCNANFSTPNDGQRPRMQMFLCTMNGAMRDGDLDVGVMTHEYGHGVSTRQVGGPNTSCLTGQQQPGEGWSDWLALVYTAKAGDTGPMLRGTGAYFFNRTGVGATIRRMPYTTAASNTFTYESVKTNTETHAVGEVWAESIWRVYWALVDKWGFEQDLQNFNINDPNEAGNKRALFYINEGFKNTRCAPTFIDTRNGIMQAAMDNFGGVDVCTIATTFAAFGLGTDARSVNNQAASATNGFMVPAQCRGGQPAPTPTPTPGCTNPRFSATFEADAGGFVRGADTCTTGQFVLGAPTLVTDGGVTTQPAGAATGTGAIFTATNTSAGVNDVDGGTCEARSPVVRVGAGSVTVNANYFHGQRDTGGDDSFVIDVLNNATGAVVGTLVNVGAVTSQAAWKPASATFTVGANTDLTLRIRATDGPATGDLVEGGLDDVQFCGNAPAN